MFMNKKEILISLAQAVIIFLYVSGVSWIMTHGESLFTKQGNTVSVMAFLLLFVFSAGATGSLIFGRPVYLFMNGEKGAAIKQLLATLAWLFIVVSLVFFVLFLKR